MEEFDLSSEITETNTEKKKESAETHYNEVENDISEESDVAIGSLLFGAFFGSMYYIVNFNLTIAIGLALFLGFVFFLLSKNSKALKKILLEPKSIYKSTDGLQEKNLSALLERRSVSDFLEYRAYEEEDGLGYYTMRNGRRGFAMRVHPGAFIGSNVESVLTSSLEIIDVEGATANFFTFASRNIEKKIKEYEEIHLDVNINVKHPEALRDMIRSRVRHFRKWVNTSMLKGVDLRLRDFINIVSFSFPEGTSDELIDKYYAQIRGTITDLHPENFSGQEMIIMVKEILSPEVESWDAPKDYTIDLSTQMTNEGTRIRTNNDSGNISIGEEWYAKTITTKNFPDNISLADFTGLFYDKMGTSVQNTIPSPFLASLTIVYDDVKKTNKKLEKIASWNIKETNKLDNNVRDANPELQRRAEEARLVRDYQTAGQVPLRAMWTLVIFDNNKNRLEEYYGKVINQFKKKNWSLVQESFGNVALLSMMYSLPLNYNNNIKEWSKRFRILFLANNTQIAPLISDSSGGAMTIPSIGRSGQLQGFDFYESNTNYNAVVEGESGSGKSYTQNEIHAHLIAAGYNIRGIDAGHSYKYLNSVCGGQYIEFVEGGDICLNFFTKILLQREYEKDDEGNIVYDENEEPIETSEYVKKRDHRGTLQNVIHVDEYKTIVPIIGQMAGVNLAASSSTASNIVNDLTTKFIVSMVERAIQESYWQLQENAGMETIYRALNDIIKELKEKKRNADVEILSRFVDSISAYCVPHGMFYNYFNGPNTINFESSYVIAELDGLSNKGDLYNVVLMSFAQTVMAEFFQERDTKKLFFVDEAWMVFDKPIVVTFLNDLYRRIRKYNGIAMTMTQLITDYFQNSLTEAMYNNANWKMFLQTDSDALEQISRGDQVYLPPLIIRLLKSIKNNKTLKIGESLIRSGQTLMIARYKTDPLAHYTYAGNGPIEKPYIEFIMDKYNLSTHESIKLAALKVEHDTDEDGAYMKLKGDSVKQLDEIQKKERLEKVMLLIEDAITMDRIVIYKQKIASVDNQSYIYENFVRLIKEDRTVLSPALFLEDSKELGLYVDISKIVIDKVFEYYENTDDEFSLNFSMEDVNNEEIKEHLYRRLSNSKASNRAIIELKVEKKDKVDTEIIKNFIEKVKKFNVRIAFDDIGMNTIDFNHLFSLDIDILKIESELIKSMEENKDSLLFVEMLVGFSKKLNMRTIAIHVDKNSTKKLIEEIGIEYVQGFLIQKPTPLGEVQSDSRLIA